MNVRVDAVKGPTSRPGRKALFLFALAVGTLFALPAAAQPSSVARESWTGRIQCVLNVNTENHRREETHTWTFTGETAGIEGAFRIHRALWTVSGKGTVTKAQGSQRETTTWTVEVPPTPVNLASFLRASDGKLIVRQWTSLARSPRAIAGTRQSWVDEQARPSGPVFAELSEWSFGWIEVEPSLTATSGSKVIRADMLPAAFSPVGATAGRNATCAWDLSRSAGAVAPAMPASTSATPPPLSPSSPPPAVPDPPFASTGPSGPSDVPAPPPFAVPSDFPPVTAPPPAYPLPGEVPPATPPETAETPPVPNPPTDSTAATQRLSGVFLTVVPANTRPWILLFGGDGRFAAENLGQVIDDPSCPLLGRGTYEMRGESLSIAFENGFTAVVPFRLEGSDPENPQRIALNGVVFQREPDPPAPLPPVFRP